MKRHLIYLLFLAFPICSALSVAQESTCDTPACQSTSNESGTDIYYGTQQPATGVMGQLPGRSTQGLTNSDIRTALERAQANRSQMEQQSGQNPYQLLCPGPFCPKIKPEEKTEFQKFVFTTTGQRLPLYGHDLFSNYPNTFSPDGSGPPPADYVIGPDDELLLRASGQIDFSARLTVDRDGQVFIPRVGTISVAGTRYDQITPRLKEAIGRVFKNFELTVTLGHLRSIQVIVAGQARWPGTYTVSSLSTIMTALFASGGPSASGSLRHIQLKRQNRLVSELDVYDLLTKGDKTNDTTLLAGDVIYIPPVGKQVAVIGSVNLPGIFEINDKTSLREQIDTAGGLSSTADGTRIMIERIDDRASRSVEDVKLDNSELARTLHDGDIVHVFPISPRVDGSVTLRGNVAVPGRYAFRPGMRIADLIPSKDALITRDYWMKQSLLSRDDLGWKNPDQPDEDQENQTDEQSSSYNRSNNRSQSGSIYRRYDNRSSSDYPSRNDQLTLQNKTPNSRGNDNGPDSLPVDPRIGEQYRKDVEFINRQRQWSDGPLELTPVTVKRLPAEINWDYAVIQRLNHEDLTSELIPFSPAKALADHNSKDNVVLESGDVITIFSQQDLKVPQEKRTKMVWIEGEVGAAGVYRVRPGETLRDLVERAGGLTKSAYLYAAEFRRESTRQRQQKEMDRLIDSMEQDLTSRARLVSNELTPDEKMAGQQELQYERATIERMKTVQVTGRIVLDLNPNDNEITAVPAIPLEDGDRFIVPARPGTVGVVGAVYSQNSFLYDPQKTIARYLAYAGGGTREADKGRLFVLRANGSVVSKQMHRSMWSGSFENTKLYPGDAIVMPQKLKTTSVLKEIRDWSQALGQYAVTAAIVATR